MRPAIDFIFQEWDNNDYFRQIIMFIRFELVQSEVEENSRAKLYSLVWWAVGFFEQWMYVITVDLNICPSDSFHCMNIWKSSFYLLIKKGTLRTSQHNDNSHFLLVICTRSKAVSRKGTFMNSLWYFCYCNRVVGLSSHLIFLLSRCYHCVLFITFALQR